MRSPRAQAVGKKFAKIKMGFIGFAGGALDVLGPNR